MNKRGHIKIVGNSSLTQSLRELEKSSLDGLRSYLRADFPAQPTNLAQDTRIANALKKFSSYKNAESSPFCHSKSFSCHSERSEESKNNPSLRDSAKQNRGNPPCEKMQKSQSGLPRRFCESARNDNFLDSSVAMLHQNNKNSARVAESTLDSADFTTNAESALGSVNSQNLIKKFNKKSLSKFLLLFAFAKSRVPLNFTDSNLPNKVDSQNLTLDSAVDCHAQQVALAMTKWNYHKINLRRLA